MARPQKWNPAEIADKLIDYIDKTDDPLIKEFCLLNDIPSSTFYQVASDNMRLLETIKKCTDKQEIYLLRTATRSPNPTFSIFRLKQPVHGYTDKQDVKIDANITFLGEDRLKD